MSVDDTAVAERAAHNHPEGVPRRRMTRARTARVVVAGDLRRIGRDRIALFFYAVLPFVLIFAIGSFIPSSDVEVFVAVVDDDGGEAASNLISALESTDGFDVAVDLDRREAERDIRLGQLGAAVLIPDGFSEAVEEGSAGLQILVEQSSADSALVRSAVSDAVGSEVALVTVGAVLRSTAGLDPDAAADLAGQAVGATTDSRVEVTTLGTQSEGDNYAFAAAGQMILFMFINSLTAGAGFIEMRRRGILSRAAAGPVDAGDMLLGLGASRFLIAVSLAVVVTVMAALVYGVQWGSILVLGGVILLFGVVCAAASALLGAVLKEPDASVSVGIPVGLSMAALGGCMFPLFLAPEPIQVASKILTPHSWALDAILSSTYDGDTILDLWANFAVLALWATVLLALAWRLAGRSIRNGSR